MGDRGQVVQRRSSFFSTLAKSLSLVAREALRWKARAAAKQAGWGSFVPLDPRGGAELAFLGDGERVILQGSPRRGKRMRARSIRLRSGQVISCPYISELKENGSEDPPLQGPEDVELFLD